MPAFHFTLSSGLFGLPHGAASVDWAVVNDSGHSQDFRITVFKGGVGVAKTPVPPGPLDQTCAAGFVIHNANSIGPGSPFVPGFYYEVVIECNDRKILPTVTVWQDHSNTIIAGTTIGPASFVLISG